MTLGAPTRPRAARRARAASWFEEPERRAVSLDFDAAYTADARTLFHEVALHRLGRAPRRVLDVGCGDGEGLEALACRVPDPELGGIDVSAVEVARARRRVADRIEHMAAEELPGRLGRFDLVLCHLNLGLWEDPVAGLRGMARTLAPGGLAYVLDLWGDTPLPVRAALLARVHGLEREYLRDQLDASLGRGEVDQLVSRAGLEHAEVLDGATAGLGGSPEEVGLAMAREPRLARAARRAGVEGWARPAPRTRSST